MPLGQNLVIDTGDADVQGVAEHLGEFDGLAHLRYRERYRGEAMRAVLDQVADTVIPRFGRPGISVEEMQAMFDEVLAGAWKEITYEVHLEPVGLRPHLAVLTQVGVFEYQGEQIRTEESRRTELDWSRADGCGRAP